MSQEIELRRAENARLLSYLAACRARFGDAEVNMAINECCFFSDNSPFKDIWRERKMIPEKPVLDWTDRVLERATDAKFHGFTPPGTPLILDGIAHKLAD